MREANIALVTHMNSLEIGEVFGNMRAYTHSVLLERPVTQGATFQTS